MALLKNKAIIHFGDNESIETCEITTIVDSGRLKLRTSAQGMKKIIDPNDGKEKYIVGKGEYITYTIELDNYSASDASGKVINIDNYPDVKAIEIVEEIGEVLTLLKPIIIEVEGIRKELTKIQSLANYSNGDYSYLENIVGEKTELRILIPTVLANTKSIITIPTENKSMLPGSEVSNIAYVDYKENPTPQPLPSEEVVVKYSLVDLSVTKKTLKDGMEIETIKCDEEFSYEIRVENSGNEEGAKIQIEDILKGNFIINGYPKVNGLISGIVLQSSDTTIGQGGILDQNVNYKVDVVEGTDGEGKKNYDIMLTGLDETAINVPAATINHITSSVTTGWIVVTITGKYGC